MKIDMKYKKVVIAAVIIVLLLVIVFVSSYYKSVAEDDELASKELQYWNISRKIKELIYPKDSIRIL